MAIKVLLLEDIAKHQVYLLLDSLCRSNTDMEAILHHATWWLSLYRKLFTWNSSCTWTGDYLHANIFFLHPPKKDVWTFLFLYGSNQWTVKTISFCKHRCHKVWFKWTLTMAVHIGSCHAGCCLSNPAVAQERVDLEGLIRSMHTLLNICHIYGI